jgi:hypothetical protein
MIGIVYEIQIGPYKQIGSTHNLKEREYHHLNLLAKNTHYNKFLQKVYNKYSSFSITELYRFPTRGEGYEKEQELLDQFYRQPYYTMEHPMATGGSRPGYDNPNYGKKRPEHSNTIKQKWEDGVYTNRSTGEWKENISKARKGKHYPKLSVACKKPKPHLQKKVECVTESLVFDSLKDAAKHYKISPGNISENITKGKIVGLRKLGKALTFRYLI